MIPYGRQNIDQSDIDAVVEVLKSDFLTQGPKIPEFEEALKQKTGAAFAIATNSATSALHLACLALGIQKGDIVWTTPISFVASSNAVLYCEGIVDFVDIDPKTYNFSYSAFENKLQAAIKSGKTPKAIIPVHLAGQSPEMDKISELCKKHKIKIIEDASHSIGAKYKGTPVGSCKYSDVTVFSFHPVKIITTGEGGALTTNDPLLAKKLFNLRSHGITRDSAEFVRQDEGAWYYEQIALGYNYRMTDIQAALGTSQLKKLDDFVMKRHQLAERYDLELNKFGIIPYQSPDSYSALHLYVFRLENPGKRNHKKFFEYMREQQIGVNLHYIPIYKQPYYQNLPYKFDPCPVAEIYYESAISLPMFATLTENDQQKVCAAVAGFFKG